MHPDITKMIKQHQGLVYHTLKKYRLWDNQDAESAAQVALWRACETFDTSIGTVFSTYAITCIKNAIFDVLRKEKELRENEVSIEDMFEIAVYEDENETVKIDYAWLHKAVDDVLNSLTGKRKEIAILWLEGYTSTTALGEKCNCSQSYASQLLAEVLSLFRKKIDYERNR